MSNHGKTIVSVLFFIVFLLPQISSAALISSEDFEGGASGWNNNSTNNSEPVGFTEFLGRFSGTSRSQSVYKTYSLPGDQTSVIIEFDFYEIDSWDADNEGANDSFLVFINNTIAVDALYAHWSDDNNADPHSTPWADPTDIGFSDWDDQKHHFSITVPTSATSIKLGFGSGLDQDIDDESWGIDNVRITTSSEALSIPTLDEWGIILLSVLLITFGCLAIRRRKLVT